MKQALIVFIGGGLGATARYWLTGAVYRYVSSSFPYGTITVNVFGCLLIGFFMSFFGDRLVTSSDVISFLTKSVSAVANIFFTTVMCLGATWLGSLIGKQI